MDKDRKLKRYRRKDYTEIVDFPVEIVGRDGVVRHYDFVESVRLYQRRFSFAPMRFRDDDLVAAEQGHCRSRIEQLRRSYFHLHGWEAATPDGPEGARPDHAGELAAFLQRVFCDPGRLDVQFTPIPRQRAGSLWYLSRAGEHGGLLLYAFAFDGSDKEAEQHAFLALLTEFRATSQHAGDAERLVGYHHATDCAFVLTGRAEEVDALAASVAEDADGASVQPNAWDEITEFVRRGDLPTAFLRCKSLVGEQPWHRDAYALGAMLAVHLRHPHDAEDLAFVGTRYFPEDGVLHVALGVARMHLERFHEAADALATARQLQPRLSIATSITLLNDCKRGHLIQAAWTSWRLRPQIRSADDAGLATLTRFGRQLTGFAILVAAMGTVCGLAALASGGIAQAGLGAIVLLAGLGWAWARRHARQLYAQYTVEDPQASLQRIRRTRRGGRSTGT